MTQVVSTPSTPLGLGVVLRANRLLVALPGHHVTRLVLLEEATTVRTGLPSVVEIAGTTHIGWDLGELLAIGSLAHAWVLMTIPHADTMLRIALRTGPCVAVDQMPEAARLPFGALTSRRAGIRGVFHPRASHGAHLFGLAIDPERLFTTEELDVSASLQREVDR